MPARLLRTALLIVTGLLVSGAADALAQSAGGAASGDSPFRVLQSTSGSKGELKGGRYRVLDPRTVFRVPEDTTIIVHFEWTGPRGPHHFAGTWRGPNNSSSTTEFDYVAQDSRFSAYWELTVPGSIPKGQWTLEARIDGAPAGVHGFEITGMDAAAPVAGPPARAPLTRQEAFARALAAAVRIEAFDAGGSRLALAAGVILDEATVATSLTAVNGAARVRIYGAGGLLAEVQEAIGWNRREDWMLFRVPLESADTVARAREPVQAGDGCFSVSSGAEGMLAAAHGELVGLNEYENAGPRISVSFFGAPGAPGAPVINEFGDGIGMVTAGLLPGARGFSMTALALDGSAPHSLVVPFERLGPAGQPTPLSVLAQRGVFIPPVTHGRQVMSGGFASAVKQAGAATQPIDQRLEFLRTDKAVTVFVSWSPAERFKGVSVLRLFDMDNRLLAETKPAKLNMRPGDLKMSAWQFTTPAPGTYRADVLLGADIAWRGYFKVK
jgi:hypothetical protein